MADMTTWVPIRRVSRREWPGEPITKAQRLEVRSRLEDGRLRARVVARANGGDQLSFECLISPSFWKETSLLFTTGTSASPTIEMNGVIQNRLIELFGVQQGNLEIEVDEKHLIAMFDDFDNEITHFDEHTPSIPLDVPASVARQAAKRTDDVHLTSAQVRLRYGKISAMTLHRWLADEGKAFPKPTLIGTRRYWSQALLDDWDAKR